MFMPSIILASYTTGKSHGVVNKARSKEIEINELDLVNSRKNSIPLLNSKV